MSHVVRPVHKTNGMQENINQQMKGSLFTKLRTITDKITAVECAKIYTQTPWYESASELYQPSDLRFSEKLVPTFADRGVYGSAGN
jgi:hypothetical protein